jgi:tetratricopeptide (TPR) repeat protein
MTMGGDGRGDGGNARRRSLAAALLNASGLGAGFLYLRSWWFAAINLAGTAGLIAAANAAGASDHRPGAWLGAYAGWLAVVIAGAWWRARRTAARGAVPAQGTPQPAAAARGTAPGSDADLAPGHAAARAFAPGLDTPQASGPGQGTPGAAQPGMPAAPAPMPGQPGITAPGGAPQAPGAAQPPAGPSDDVTLALAGPDPDGPGGAQPPGPADETTMTLAAPDAPRSGPAQPAADRPTLAISTPPAPGPAQPPAQPPAPRPGWRPYAVGVLLLVLVAGGVTALRGVPQRAFDDGQAAQAAGDCEEAVGHYDDAGASWFQFTLTPAPADAGRGRAGCELLRAAMAREDAGEYEQAIVRYEDYIRQGGGTPVWADAESHLAGLRLEYADTLAEAATGDAAGDTAGYAEALDAYAAVREHHPDSPQARDVPARVDALYADGTTAYADEDYCAAIDQLQAFTSVDDESETREAADLAGRADEALPEAYFGCGQTQYDGDRFCEAIGSFQQAADAGREGVAGPLNRARYDCGMARVDDGNVCEAVETLEQVDGGGVADRARDGLRGALYDCGVARFRDRDHAGARESLRRVVDDFSGSQEADDARDLLIAVEVNEATGRDPDGLLPGGNWKDSTGGTVTMEVFNAAGERLELLYAGPENGRIEVRSGPDSGTGEGRCENPEGLPSVTVTLPTGDYQTVARSLDDPSITEFGGEWHLDPGYLYTDCYYITDDGFIY